MADANVTTQVFEIEASFEAVIGGYFDANWHTEVYNGIKVEQCRTIRYEFIRVDH